MIDKKYYKKKIVSLEEEVKNLKKQNCALEYNNELLRKTDEVRIKQVTALTDELEKVRRQNTICFEELKEIKSKYLKALASFERMRKEYKNEINNLIKNIKRKQ